MEEQNKIVEFVENAGEVVEDVSEALDEVNELADAVEEVADKAGGILTRILEGIQRIINYFKNLFRKD